jgi:hypothetical protein
MPIRPEPNQSHLRIVEVSLILIAHIIMLIYSITALTFSSIAHIGRVLLPITVRFTSLSG